MPIYLFQKGKKIVEVVLGMNDPKVYLGKSGKEEGWKRVWINPQMSVDTKTDPFSQKDFVKKTNKKGKYSDLLEASKEESARREQIAGKDPIKEKYFEDWSKKRGGKRKHPEQAKQEAKENIKNNKFFTLEE